MFQYKEVKRIKGGLALFMALLMTFLGMPVNLLAVRAEETQNESGKESEKEAALLPGEDALSGKADQTPLVMDTTDVQIPWNEAFTREAQKSDAADAVYTDFPITYSSSNEELALVEGNTGTVTFSKPSGEASVTITATVSGNDAYNDVTASYNVKAEKADPCLKFADEIPANCTFSEELTFQNQASFAAESGQDKLPDASAITYSCMADSAEIADIEETTGLLTIKKTGTVTVQASSAENDYFTEGTASYTLTINPAEQGDFKFSLEGDSHETKYGGEPFSNPATGEAEGTVTEYTSSDESIATVDTDGKVTAQKSGIVTITARNGGNENYQEKEITYSLNILGADQTITFEEENPSMQYNADNPTYQNVVEITNQVGKDAGQVSYTSGDTEAATVATDGTVTVKKAGQVEITATAAATDYLAEASKSYTLTVCKTPQTIAFSEAVVEALTGQSIIGLTAAPVGDAYGTGELTYSIKEDANGILGSIDSSTGAITVSEEYKAGTAVIEAKKAEDDNYEAAAASYEIHIAEWQPEDVYYTLTGDKKLPDSEWFVGNVSVEAVDGYEISYDKNASTAWKAALEDAVTTDGSENLVSFYIKRISDGAISKQLEVSVKKDATLPTASITAEGLNGWEKFLSIIFGWSKDEVKFVVESGDAAAPEAGEESGSGVAKIQYFVDTDNTVMMDKDTLEALDNSRWSTYTDVGISLPENSKAVVYAKVTDNAGNYVYASTNGVVFDAAAPTAVLTILSTPSEEGFYHSDVTVQVEASDAAPYSGIKSIEYWIENNGAATKGSNDMPVILYSFQKDNPEYTDLAASYNSNTENDNIIIPAADNNSDNVVLYVRVTDNAGNVKNIGTDEKVYTAKQELKISTSRPVIQVSYENDPTAVETYNNVTYYNRARKAKIVITGRTSAFDETLPVIAVTTARYHAASGTYESVSAEGLYTLSDWITEEGAVPGGDDATHTLYVDFSGDANYSFSVSYTDKAGNAAGEFQSDSFTIDTTQPEGSITIGENTWSKWLEKLSFHLFKNTAVTVSGTSSDVTSPVKSVEYYKTAQTEIITTDTLDSITGWTEFHEFSVSSDEMFTVYLKITDYAGNIKYLCSDGYIVDMENAVIGATVPEANANGYYNGDVIIPVAVTDRTETAYSGIQSVEYWVESWYNGKTTETQRETVYRYENSETAAYTELKKEWTGTITVDAAKNNYDDVRVYVKAVDNAGNETVYQTEDGTDYISLKIDSLKPVINISYDVNSPTKTVGERGYYKTCRTATVAVTERSSEFDAEAATNGILIAAVDGTGQPVDLTTAVAVSTWTTMPGENPNADTHTATISFMEDANYDLQVSYTDKAGNCSDTPAATGSDTPFCFTVDRTAPTAVIKVGTRIWNRLLTVITWLMGNESAVTVKAEAEDATSPVEIKYFITDDTAAKTAEELDNASIVWTDYNAEFSVTPDNQFVVYLKVSDYAGNSIYINSDGQIIEQTASVITLIPTEPVAMVNGVGVYNGNVNVTVAVDEGESNYSGIKTVEYWVTADNEKTQEETLYSFAYTGTMSAADRKRIFSKTVSVDAAKNNSSNVTLFVRATDNAGNVSMNSLRMDIDITAPVIEVSYEDQKEVYKTVPGSSGKEHGYFGGSRTATIRITERANHFDAEAATKGIAVTAVNAEGTTVIENTEAMISGWTLTPGEDADSAVHTATIVYQEDANYTFSIGYTDMAKNRNQAVGTGVSVAPYSFTVDKTAPTGTVTVENMGTWDKLLAILTFGRWSKTALQVSAAFADVTSPFESVSYYKTANTKALTVAELDAVSTWIPYQSFSVAANEKFSVYLKLVDAAGNTTYIGTDGIIVDDTLPVIENVSPQISISADGAEYGVVNTDIPVSVSVADPIMGDTKAYSGLKEITYTVYNQGSQTQEGTLFSFETENSVYDELVQNWSGDGAIVVDKGLNNSNDIEVKVVAVDNAGNIGEQSIKLKIDTTVPRIEVAYDNNDGDTTFAENDTEAYFKADRTATITVYERNFSPENTELTITNTDGENPSISAWSKTEGGGNGDDTANTATITFSADGDYTFAFTCKDIAGNEAEKPDYGTSLAPVKFTVDKTLPQFSLSYDNNDYQNENYYRERRTATLTITEHNFESSRVNVVLNARDNGQAAALPTVSGWSNNGDVHTATIYYAEDAQYDFDIEYQDKAGNVMEDFTEQSFYVDMTAPVVTISNIVDKSANSDAGNIGFTITATDTNFDVFVPELDAVVREGNNFAHTSFDIGSYSTVSNGRSYTVNNIDRDGIYRIMCTAVDKAGNEFTEVNLYHADGTAYTEQRAGEDMLLMFSVNRDGSTFELGSDTAKVAEQYYVQNVRENITITEINANEVVRHSVSVGENELTEGIDYNVNADGGDGSWWKYTYSINKELFEKEGEYNIVIASMDEADNNAFSDVKSAGIRFVVDRTAPVVSVSGLENNGRYQTNEQTVTLIPSDDGGRMKSLAVRRVDEDGRTLEDLISLEGDTLEQELGANGGALTFTLSEGLYQNVRIICMDYAADEEGNTNTYDETFTDVSVSASSFMIFWTNKTVRNIVVAGGSVTVCGAVAAPGIFKWRRARRKQ